MMKPHIGQISLSHDETSLGSDQPITWWNITWVRSVCYMMKHHLGQISLSHEETSPGSGQPVTWWNITWVRSAYHMMKPYISQISLPHDETSHRLDQSVYCIMTSHIGKISLSITRSQWNISWLSVLICWRWERNISRRNLCIHSFGTWFRRWFLVSCVRLVVLQNIKCVKVMFVWSVFKEWFKIFMWNVYSLFYE